MKTRKALDRLRDILSADKQVQLAKYDSLKKALKLLRDKKVRLEKKLITATDEESREKITQRLRIISAQRKKGLMLLQNLKQDRE